MNKIKHPLLISSLLALTAAATTASAQNWPQSEQAYLPSTQSPQWVDSNRAPNPVQPQMNTYQQPNMPYAGQAPMPYPAPNYGYAPYGNMPYNNAQRMPYMGNTGWGSWPNRNNMMPSMPNMGNWSMPNMDMGNWSTPNMPDMNNMPGMPNMDNFSMPSPSFEMPSPSMNFPSMNMPFFN